MYYCGSYGSCADAVADLLSSEKRNATSVKVARSLQRVLTLQQVHGLLYFQVHAVEFLERN